MPFIPAIPLLSNQIWATKCMESCITKFTNSRVWCMLCFLCAFTEVGAWSRCQLKSWRTNYIIWKATFMISSSKPCFEEESISDMRRSLTQRTKFLWESYKVWRRKQVVIENPLLSKSLPSTIHQTQEAIKLCKENQQAQLNTFMKTGKKDIPLDLSHLYFQSWIWHIKLNKWSM